MSTDGKREDPWKCSLLKGQSLSVIVLPKFWYSQALSRLQERSGLYSLENIIFYIGDFFFCIYSSTSLEIEINLCLVCNEVSLSLLFQAFPVLLRLGGMQSKMPVMCCSLLFTLSYLGFF